MRIACIYLLFIVLIQIVPNLLSGQNISFTRIKPPKKNPYSLITGMAQDSMGYMWFTSGSVLYRYDGYEFTTYQNDPFNSSSLGGKSLECILIDKQGLIWIGDLFDGLDKFDPRTGIFTHYPYRAGDSEGLTSEHISVLIEDHLGYLWVGTPNGLNRLDKKTGKFNHYMNEPNDSTSISNNDIISIYEDRSGVIWVGTGSVFHKPGQILIGGGLNKFDRATGKFTRYVHNPNDPQSLIDNRIKSILEDSHGVFWVGTAGENGLHTMDRKKGTFTRYLYDPELPDKLSRGPQTKYVDYADDHITFIREDSIGTIWIGTFEGGLTRYDPKSNKVTRFNATNNPDSLHENGVWSMASSRDGIIWIGSWEFGSFNLYKADPFRFNLNYHEMGSSISSFYEDASGNLYLGCYGLYILNKDRKIVSRLVHDPLNQNSISENFISSIYADKKGTIWVGTQSLGLNAFDPRTHKFTRYTAIEDYKMEPGYVISMLEDSHGEFWVGTSSGLLNMNRQTGKFKRVYVHTEEWGDEPVLSIIEDHTGTIWLGENNAGLYSLNRINGKFNHYLAETSVYSILEHSDHSLWANTNRGLFRKDKSSEDFVPYEDMNLSYDPVYLSTVLEDNHQNLWMSAISGIGIFDTKKNESRYLALEEDMLTGSNQDYSPCYKLRNGDFVIGKATGFYTLSPDDVLKETRPPQIVVSNFIVFGKQEKAGENNILKKIAPGSKEISLNYNENVFSLEFAAIHYGKPEDNRHMYMLEGYDKGWHKAGFDRKISYYNVPPGRYVMKLKASNNRGRWVEQDTDIIISPAWWNTWWFRLVAAFTVFATFYAIIRWRMQSRFKSQLQRSENEKQLSALQHKTTELEMYALRSQMNPHFIFNSLNSINRFILQNNKDLASEYLTKFSKLVRLIFHNSQTALITIDSEMEALQLYLELEALRFDYHFDFNIAIQQDLDISALKVPPLIIQPFVENAIWHGLMHKEEKGHIEIDVIVENDLLVCRIKDDGIGRKKAAELKGNSKNTHKSMGMRITADRIALLQRQKLIHNTIQINDLVLADGSAGGTEIIIKLPLRYD